MGLLELWSFIRRRPIIGDNYIGYLEILNDGLGRKNNNIQTKMLND
jgi:hypothetical protein